MKTIRVGLIGCGNHATQCVHSAARTIPELELVACCDQQQEKAEGTARRFGIPHVYTDPAAMLERQRLDACLVVIGPDQHQPVAMQCLRAGVHVFVEKPPARTVEHCRELLELAAAQGKMVMPAFMMRFRPLHQRIKQIMDSMGEAPIGFTMRLSAGGFGSRVPQHPPAFELLLDAGIHLFDLARWLFGDFRRVHAEAAQYDSTRNFFAISARLERGVGMINLNSCQSWGLISGTEVSSHPSEWLEIVGNGTAVRLDNCQKLTYFRKDGIAEYTEPNYSMISFHEKQQYYLGGYCHELQHFAQCILSNTAPSVTMLDAVKATEAVYAVWRSSQEGRSIDL